MAWAHAPKPPSPPLPFGPPIPQYIYEYGADTYPAPDQAVRFQPGPLGLQPPTEAISLADYRARHALYRQGGAASCTVSSSSVGDSQRCRCGMPCRTASRAGVQRALGCHVPATAARLHVDVCVCAQPPGQRWCLPTSQTEKRMEPQRCQPGSTRPDPCRPCSAILPVLQAGPGPAGPLRLCPHDCRLGRPW